MRLLGASFKKIAEKLDGQGSEDKTKRQDFGVGRAIGQFMPRIPMIGFQQIGALFVLSSCRTPKSTRAQATEAETVSFGAPLRLDDNTPIVKPAQAQGKTGI